MSLYIQTHRMYQRVKSNVNYGLRVIVMCQCRIISCNKFTTLVGDVDNGGGCACEGGGDRLEISVPLLNTILNMKCSKNKANNNSNNNKSSKNKNTLNLV